MEGLGKFIPICPNCGKRVLSVEPKNYTELNFYTYTRKDRNGFMYETSDYKTRDQITESLNDQNSVECSVKCGFVYDQPIGQFIDDYPHCLVKLDE